MTSIEEFERWWKTVHPWQRTENREGAELGWQAARATAPAWHDAPTAPGLWLSNGGLTNTTTTYSLEHCNGLPGRWFGPIPKDES